MLLADSRVAVRWAPVPAVFHKVALHGAVLHKVAIHKLRPGKVRRRKECVDRAAALLKAALHEAVVHKAVRHKVRPDKVRPVKGCADPAALVDPEASPVGWAEDPVDREEVEISRRCWSGCRRSTSPI